MAKQAHLRDVAAALTGTAPLLQWNPAAMARSATALEPMAADVHGSICASQSFVVRPMAATVSPVVMADMAVEPHRVTAARTAATVAEVAWAAEAVGITAAEAVGITAAEAVVDIPAVEEATVAEVAAMQAAEEATAAIARRNAGVSLEPVNEVQVSELQ